MTNKVKEHIGFHCTLILLEYILQEVLNKIKDKSITHSVIRIQSDASIMLGFYCIAFLEYVIAGKTFLHYANLFSPNNYQKNR